MVRGQSVVEYIVVLAVILLVLGAFVVVLQGDTFGQRSAQGQSQSLQLSSLDVGVVLHSATEDQLTMRIVNNLDFEINVTQVVVGGRTAQSDEIPTLLKYREQATLVLTNIDSIDQSRYAYSFSITYVDTSTGVTYVQNRSDILLTGPVGAGSSAAVELGGGESEGGSWTIDENLTYASCWTDTPNGNGFYPICSCFDLNLTRTELTRNYSLNNSIDFSEDTCSVFREGAGWDPIGNCTGNCEFGNFDNAYTGYFHGYNYVVDNLLINDPEKNGSGLFGIAGNSTHPVRFTSVNITNIDIVAGDDVGGLVGAGYSINVSNISVTGSIRQKTYAIYAGGILGNGYYGSEVENSYAQISINSTGVYIGGLAGYVDSILDSSAEINVTGGVDQAGGLAGLSRGLVNNSFAVVDMENGTTFGGLVGNLFSGTINYSYSVGNLNGSTYIGGLVGAMVSADSIDNSYTTVNVSCSTSYCGGVVGANFGGTIQSANWTNYTGVPNYCVGDATATGGSNPAGCTAIQDGISSCWSDTPDGNGFHPLCTCFDLNLTRTNLTRNYSLQNDIDFAAGSCTVFREGAGWDPIGNCTGDCANPTPFVGFLYGNNKTIDNLYINGSRNSSGLFSQISNNFPVISTTIRDLNITNANITAGEAVGILSGKGYYINITNVYIEGEVQGAGRDTGGLIGSVGSGNGYISNSYAQVNVNGSINLGGLIGAATSNSLIVTDTGVDGAVKGVGGYYIGGLVGGGSYVTIDNSYFNGTINTTGNRVGGLVGRGAFTANNSNVTGSIVGASRVGGLLGDNAYYSTSIENSYVDVNMTSTGSYVGGVVGTQVTSGFLNTTWIYYSGIPSYCVGNATVGGGTNPAGCFANTEDGLLLTGVNCWNTTATAGYNPICTCFDLNETQTELTWNYSLEYDIDFTYGDCSVFRTGDGFEPIGTGLAFEGNFEGNHRTIKNLHSWNYFNGGLFAYINPATGSRVVGNLTLADANVSGTGSSGLLIGVTGDVDVFNVTVTGYLNGSSRIGGLVGENTGSLTINHSGVVADITGSDYVGGINGYGGQTIDNSYFLGNITASSYIGGITGFSLSDTITNSYTRASIVGNSALGGLVGQIIFGATISDSYAEGNVFGDSTTVGGLVGFASGDAYIDSSYTTGNITGSDTVGGIIGIIGGTSYINRSYASGNVSGTSGSSNFMGGLVGWGPGGQVIDSNYSGLVNCSSTYCGGLVGYFDGVQLVGANTWINWSSSGPHNCVGSSSSAPAGQSNANCTP